MISVAIVAARRSLRNGWQTNVEKMPDAECVGIFSTLSAYLQMPPGFAPNIVLLGLESNDRNSSRIKDSLSRFPNTLVLVLAVRLDEKQLFAALRAGANGYLTQGISPNRLRCAISDLYEGGVPLCKAASQHILASFRHSHQRNDSLSDREQEVYGLLCEAKNYREIAEILFVSQNTVRFHIKNIYKKLDVKSRHEAMRLAYRAKDR